MNLKQVRALLAGKIAKETSGNESEWARANGLSQGYVTHVRRGGRLPGKKILAALGLKKITEYEFIRQTEG